MAADPNRGKAGRAARAAGARVAELFEEHGRMVYGVCRLLLRDREEAEDATQQTFLSAYRSLLGGAEPRDPAAWLGTIARNECRGRIRSHMGAPLALVSDAVEPGADVEQLAGRHEEVTALVGVLSELPRHQREAIVLREFFGLSHEEVSAALGVTPSAVDSLLVRARRRLQHELRPARLASGALVLPLALRESLAQAVPGFAPAPAGALGPILSLPIAAKLTATAATITAVGVVAGSQPPAPGPVRSSTPAPAAVDGPPFARTRAKAPPPEPIRVSPAAHPVSRNDDDDEENDARGDQAGGRSDPIEDERDERDDARKPSPGSGVQEQDADEPDAAEADEVDQPESQDHVEASDPQEQDEASGSDEPEAGES
jgi:RNA polymerase sigma-70 factor, ECF subfamily